MIVIQNQTERIIANVYGEFTLSDFREFEEVVNQKVAAGSPLDLFVDLRDMADFTLDTAIENISFSRGHTKDFRRIAVVTNNPWVSWRTWLAQIFMEAQMRVFDDDEPALVWLDSDFEDKTN